MTLSMKTGLSSRKLLCSIGIGAVVTAVALFAGAMVETSATPTLSAVDEQAPSTHATTPAAAAMASTTTSPPTSETPTSETPTSETPTSEASPFPSDERGFVDTQARCDSSQYTIVFGRTERSLVAVCLSNGDYAYRGVRISDQATLTADVEAQSDGEFVARVDNIAYVVSPEQFYVMSGSDVIREEPWLEYHSPELAAESSVATSAAAETFQPVG